MSGDGGVRRDGAGLPVPVVVRRRGRLLALAGGVAAALVLVLALAAGGGGDEDSGPRPVTLLDALAPVLGTGATASSRDAPEGTLGVPLDRAAAQLFLVGFAGTSAEAPFLRRLRVRDWGGVVLTGDNWGGSRSRLAGLTRAVRRTARRAGHTPPLVLGVAPGEPGEVVPGLVDPSDTLVERAQRTGRALRDAGFDAVLGPSLDLGYGGGPYEGRGLDPMPRAATASARAAVRGWQAAGLEAVVGHFPGEGAATDDPRLNAASVGVTAEQLEAADLVPFRAAAPDTRAVQLSAASYVRFDGVTPASILPEAVALLRRTDPDAVAVSADLQAVALATGGTVPDAAIAALRAGVDLLYVPGDAADQEAAWRAVVTAMRTRKVPVRRVAEALGRAASLKRRLDVASR